MTDLTQDEITCLLIANEGECMLAISRWEKSIDHLVELGLMKRLDKFNNIITPKGKEAAAKESGATDDRFADLSLGVHNARAAYKTAIDTAAQQIVAAAREKNKLTGQFPNKCVYDIGQEAIAKAMEILG